MNPIAVENAGTFPLPSSESFQVLLERKLASQIRWNIIFTLLLILEIFTLAFFFPFFIQSAFFAFMIALLVMTFFGYLMFRQYSASEKRDYFEITLNDWLASEKRKGGYREGQPESHLRLSKLCSDLADDLYQKEYRCLRLPKLFHFARRATESLSCMLFWRDIYFLRELLLEKAVEEHLSLVRIHPSNLDAHTFLANAYIMLSGLYALPENEEKDRYIPKERYGIEAQNKFRETAKRAIEEFTILKEYAPKDPWIYSQLAFSYKDLKMPEEEKKAYEALLELKPNDYETRYKLGALYFKQGENAKGLKVYDELKKAQFLKADELLTIYGSKHESSF